MALKAGFHVSGESIEQESLRVDINKRKITGYLALIRFIDADTNQVVLYMPSLDITSYGETEDKAEEMLRFSINDFFSHLIKMPFNELKTELGKLGWKKDVFRNKQFSKAYIDINGDLQGFNAVENTVERLTLVA